MIYEPSEDSFLLAKEVKKLAKGKSFLDMGAGSGIQSEYAKSAGSKNILAVDINPKVVQFLKKKSIPAQVSDLFSKVEGKFDLIAFNPPYLPEDKLEDGESRRITTGGKIGDEIILRFLKDAPKHLNDNGAVLLLLSSLTPRQHILSLLNRLNMMYEVIAEEKLFFEKLEVWKIDPSV